MTDHASAAVDVSTQLVIMRLGEPHTVLVDASDQEFVRSHKWHLGKNGYVARNTPMVNGVRGPKVYLHRELLGLTPGDGIDVDHINHAGLDNRRSNLRACTHLQNMQNISAWRTSKYSAERGVSYCLRFKVWKAYLMVDGQRWNKNCATEAEAIVAVRARRAELLNG